MKLYNETEYILVEIYFDAEHKSYSFPSRK